MKDEPLDTEQVYEVPSVAVLATLRGEELFDASLDRIRGLYHAARERGDIDECKELWNWYLLEKQHKREFLSE